MKDRILWAGSICLLALLFACNNEPEHTTVAPENPPDSVKRDTAMSPTAAVQSEHLHTIEISKMKFNPDSLTIPVGDTVVWVNNDITNHCVTEVSKGWTSGALTPGQSYKKAFKKSANYFCAIHMVMNGKITVQ